MRRSVLSFIICICAVTGVQAKHLLLSDPVLDPFANNAEPSILPADMQAKADAIYDSLKLGDVGLERDIFYKGYKGYLYLLYKGVLNNVNMLTIADFSQSSRNKRLYVIDLANMQLAFNTWVSHGKNSGAEMATSFSNLKDSYKSTLGFMITDDTYKGQAGYSLRFKGAEPGINDRVRFRDIVLHGSRYVNGEKAEEDGRVGNSLGCPAVPLAIHKKVIDMIKGGSVYFIYHPDEYYNASSPILHATLVPPTPLINTGIVNNAATSPVAPPANATMIAVPATDTKDQK